MKFALLALMACAMSVAGQTYDITGLPISQPSKLVRRAVATQATTFPTICTGGSSKFAVIAPNVAVADAAAVCTSLGLSFADITSGNFAEAIATEYKCVGTNKGTWVRSWDTNTYGLSGMEMRTGSNANSTAGTVVVPYSATNPVMCQGPLVPKCSSGLTPLLVPFTGDVDQDGFVGSNNIFELDSSQYAIQSAGYITGAISKPFVAYNGYGVPGDFQRGGAVFDVAYLYATAAWTNDLTVTFTGLKAGTVVSTKTVILSATKPSLVLLNFLGIDDLRVETQGGENAGLGGYGQHVAIDNMAICV